MVKLEEKRVKFEKSWRHCIWMTLCARASQAVYLLKRTKTWVAAFLAFKFYIWFQCQVNLVSNV